MKLTSKYTFKLYIDCIIISHSCYPLSLISITNYLALKTTRLPLLISDVNDEEIAELPTFSDDWENAKLIQDYHLNANTRGVDHQRNFNHQFYNNWSHWEEFNFGSII